MFRVEARDWGDIQMRAICATAAMLIFAATFEVGAADVNPPRGCVTKLPAERSGYWRYRIIDGRKCWYGPGGYHRQSRNDSRRPRYRPPRAEIFVDVVRWDDFNVIDAGAVDPAEFQLRWEGQR